MDDSQRSANSRSFWIGTLCYLNSALVWGLNIPLTAALFASFEKNTMKEKQKLKPNRTSKLKH